MNPIIYIHENILLFKYIFGKCVILQLTSITCKHVLKIHPTQMYKFIAKSTFHIFLSVYINVSNKQTLFHI